MVNQDPKLNDKGSPQETTSSYKVLPHINEVTIEPNKEPDQNEEKKGIKSNSVKEELELKLIRTEIWGKRLSMFAILGAALWALYTFGSLREVYIAEAKVADLESRNVSLNLSMSKNELGVDEIGRIGIELVIKIENKGILPIDVDLTGGETITLSHVMNVLYNEDTTNGIQNVEKMPVGKVYSSKAYNRLTQKTIRDLTSSAIRPNSERTVHYFFYVDEPGVYLASFISEIPQDVMEEINKREIGDKNEKVTESSAWVAQKYLRITGSATTEKSNKH